MKENFQFECQCGRKIRVELFEAGTTKQCPACNVETTVPNTIKLKELSGDKYPHLLPFDKIRKTLEEGESPFDGNCHYCFDVDADYRVPITFKVMAERSVTNNGIIRPALAGLKLAAAAAEENWESTTFPLSLCEGCHSKFQKDRFWAMTTKLTLVFSLLVLAALFLYCSFYYSRTIVAIPGFPLLVLIAWFMRFRMNVRKKRAAPYIFMWIRTIRWVPEMIDAEDEFKISVGQSLPYHEA